MGRNLTYYTSSNQEIVLKTKSDLCCYIFPVKVDISRYIP